MTKLFFIVNELNHTGFWFGYDVKKRKFVTMSLGLTFFPLTLPALKLFLLLQLETYSFNTIPTLTVTDFFL